MSGLMPPGPLSYNGQVAVPWINKTFPPTDNDIEFNVPTVWIDTAGKDAYILVSKALGVATWASIGGDPGQLNELTPDSGGAVTPVSGNINLQGDSVQGISTSNNGSGNLKISASNASSSQKGVASFNSTNFSVTSGNVTSNAITVNGGSGVTITGSPVNLGGSITISANNGGMTWSVVTANQTLADGNGYFANAVSQLQFALPATSDVGDVYEIVDMGGNGWTITQGTGQSIKVENLVTTTGASGSISSTGTGVWIELVCNVANTSWFANVKQGVVTIV